MWDFGRISFLNKKAFTQDMSDGLMSVEGGGGILYSEVQYIMGNGYMGGPNPLWTYRHKWKHYLPATSLAGGKMEQQLSWTMDHDRSTIMCTCFGCVVCGVWCVVCIYCEGPILATTFCKPSLVPVADRGGGGLGGHGTTWPCENKS